MTASNQSINYNMSMFTNLAPSVFGSLDSAELQLGEVASGRRAFSDLDAGDGLQVAAGALDMVGFRALSRVADVLRASLEGLRYPERSGWPRERGEQVIAHSQSLLRHLISFLRRIEESGPFDLPVLLWSPTRDLQRLAGLSPDVPEAFFDGEADFSSEAFSELAAGFLSDLGSGAERRLRAASVAVRNASTVQDMREAMRGAAEVFRWLRQERHKPGYMGYFLAVEARIALAFLENMHDLLDYREMWAQLLESAAIEVKKFGTGHPRANPDAVRAVALPLLKRWPDHWVGSVEIMREFDHRFRIGEFWQIVDGALRDSVHDLDAFSEQKPSILQSLNALRNALIKVQSLADESLSGSRKLAEDGGQSVDAVLRDLHVLDQAAPLFPRPEMSSLVRLLDQSVRKFVDLLSPSRFDVLSQQERDDLRPRLPVIATELAFCILLLENAVSDPRHGGLSLPDQVDLMEYRLDHAFSPKGSEMSDLMVPVWADDQMSRLSFQAEYVALEEASKDLRFVESQLAEKISDPDQTLDTQRISTLTGLVPGTLDALDHPEASLLAQDLHRRLADVLPLYAHRVNQDDNFNRIKLALTGVLAYMDQVRERASDPKSFLRTVYREVMGSDMPAGRALVSDFDEFRQSNPKILEDAVHLAEQVGHPDPLHAGEEVLPLDPSPVRQDLSDITVVVPSTAMDDGGGVPDVSLGEASSPSYEEEPVGSVQDAAFTGIPQERSADLPLPPAQVPAQVPNEPVLVTLSRSSPAETEMAEIFLLGFEEALTLMAEARDGLIEQPEDPVLWKDLRRQYHTIKGDSRQMKLLALGDAAAQMEEYVDGLIAASAPYDEVIDAAVGHSMVDLDGWRSDLSVSGTAAIDPVKVREWITESGVAQGSDAGSIPADPDAGGEKNIEYGDPVEYGSIEDAPVLVSPAVPASDPADRPGVVSGSEDRDDPSQIHEPQEDPSPARGFKMVLTPAVPFYGDDVVEEVEEVAGPGVQVSEEVEWAMEDLSRALPAVKVAGFAPVGVWIAAEPLMASCHTLYSLRDVASGIPNASRLARIVERHVEDLAPAHGPGSGHIQVTESLVAACDLVHRSFAGWVNAQSSGDQGRVADLDPDAVTDLEQLLSDERLVLLAPPVPQNEVSETLPEVQDLDVPAPESYRVDPQEQEFKEPSAAVPAVSQAPALSGSVDDLWERLFDQIDAIATANREMATILSEIYAATHGREGS